MKTMEATISELEMLLAMQESYFEHLITLGLLLEETGKPEKALDIYKKGIQKAEKAKTEISYTMLGLLD
jgi:hypothetical protein